jgi:hypothetical protein
MPIGPPRPFDKCLKQGFLILIGNSVLRKNRSVILPI